MIIKTVHFSHKKWRFFESQDCFNYRIPVDLIWQSFFHGRIRNCSSLPGIVTHLLLIVCLLAENCNISKRCRWTLHTIQGNRGTTRWETKKKETMNLNMHKIVHEAVEDGRENRENECCSHVQEETVNSASPDQLSPM